MYIWPSSTNTLLFSTPPLSLRPHVQEPTQMSTYAKHADGQNINPPNNYTILPLNTTLTNGDIPFDVYSGWRETTSYDPTYDPLYHCYAIDDGRWTAWARPISSQPDPQPDVIQWWGYIHDNGSVHVKRYFDREDILEAQDSPFVSRVFGEFAANNRDEAIQIIKDKL